MELLAQASQSLGVVSIIAGAVAVWRSAGKTQTARVWRDEAEAQETRADRLERAVAELTKRVEQLERENAVLRDLVTGGNPNG